MLNNEAVKKGLDGTVVSWLLKLPVVSFYARARGWDFVIAWCHRVTGIFLVVVSWVLVSTHGPLHGTGLPGPVLGFLYWLLSVPIVFHCFNGGRIILYEIFGSRNDQGIKRWVFGLCALYQIVLGLLMIAGNQHVSPYLSWLIMLVGALILGYGVAARIWRIGHSFFWKLQRVSGAFLLGIVPAYILLLAVDPARVEEARTLVTPFQRSFIKIVYGIAIAGALYHGGYGLWSILGDYFASRPIRVLFALLMVVVMAIFAAVGIRVAWSS